MHSLTKLIAQKVYQLATVHDDPGGEILVIVGCLTKFKAHMKTPLLLVECRWGQTL